MNEVATIIGVSSATIRNWTKAGHVCPIKTRPLSFMDSDVLNLKKQLSSGTLQKLKKRANKSGSETTFLPSEYAGNAGLVEKIQWIADLFKSARLDISATMFFVSLRILELRGEMKRNGAGNVDVLSSCHSWERKSTKNEIERWYSQIGAVQLKNEYREIYYSLSQIDEDDFLGLLYQCLLNEGEKSNRGSYFTASKIVEDSLIGKISHEERFLDPCCGTGKYLIYAAKLLKLSPENIYGFDIDELAVRIARINLLITFEPYDFIPNIHCLDALTELATSEVFCNTNDLIGSFDFIATNPPWGAYKNYRIPERYANGVKSGESFSLFLAKSLTLLKEGGLISFILPESILKIRTHSDIREILLKQSQITTIAKLGRKFTGVFTEAIRLDIIKVLPNTGWLVAIEENGVIAHVEQDRFRENEYFTFDVEVKTEEERILNKIFAVDHSTLFKNAEWALGIVTGNNKKHILNIQEKGTEAIFRGSDVHQFKIGEPRAFIRFTQNDFQQVAPERFFRAKEKLIYRFISKLLIFAYDDKQSLTLNSANILIPRIPGVGLKVALAYLNSSVFLYIFKKKYSTHKVLRGDIEKLPFPKIGKDIHDEIENLVNSMLKGADKRTELDEIIFSTFNLTNEDISLIRTALKG